MLDLDKQNEDYWKRTECLTVKLLDRLQTTQSTSRRAGDRTVMQDIVRLLDETSTEAPLGSWLFTLFEMAELIAIYSIKIESSKSRAEKKIRDKLRRLPEPKAGDAWEELVRIWLAKDLSIEYLLMAARASGKSEEVWGAMLVWRDRRSAHSEARAVLRSYVQKPKRTSVVLLRDLTCDLRDIFQEKTGGPHDGLIGEMLHLAGLEDVTGIPDQDEIRRVLKGRIEHRPR